MEGNGIEIKIDAKKIYKDDNGKIIIDVEGFPELRDELFGKFNKIMEIFNSTGKTGKKNIFRKYIEIVNLKGTMGYCDVDKVLQKLNTNKELIDSFNKELERMYNTELNVYILHGEKRCVISKLYEDLTNSL